jgi:S1-C subfamily serine protease
VRRAALVLFLALGCRSHTDAPPDPGPIPDPLGASPALPRRAFPELARAIMPSVVTIRTTARTLAAPIDTYPWLDEAPDDIQTALGSGVIIDPRHILTNDHVVAGASDIKVGLDDGREVTGRLVGRDEETDLALVEVTADGLTPAPLGDSDELQVGDWVLAVGNPFGLEHTVTAGIISATGRALVAGDAGGKRTLLATFLQTDASINPGNSGGPLIDTMGKVIGIATAAESRGNGIGYAVPINLARQLVPILLRDGNVRRTWLGVYLRPVTDAVAAEVGLSPPRGVFVDGVVEGAPAAQAGLTRGDVVLTFDGKPVDARSLPFLASTAGVGHHVALEVWRERQAVTLDVLMEALPE